MTELPVNLKLKELGLAPSKALGQNFLKDQNLLNKIVDAVLKAGRNGRAEAEQTVDVLEIGPGLGAMTKPLLAARARVWAVEFDRGLAAHLNETASDYGGRLTVLNQDILTLDPGPIAQSAGGPLVFCGNLPYNISSRILFWFLKYRRLAQGGIFMLQKEMATRLTAGPGSKDYGRLAAALSLWCRLGVVTSAPAAAFHPRPKVDSVVVALTPVDLEEEPKLSPDIFGRFTAAAFLARRKTIANNLSAAYGRDRTQAALEALAIDPGRRAETISPKLLLDLATLLTS